MQKFPDNEFDKWIKNSLEEPEIEFDPVAWKQMEQQLDVASLPFWNVWINNFSLIFASAVIVYIFLFNVQDNFSDGNKLNIQNKKVRSPIELKQSLSEEIVDNFDNSFHHLNQDNETDDQLILNEKKAIKTKVKNNQVDLEKDPHDIIREFIKDDQENINDKEFLNTSSIDKNPTIGLKHPQKEYFVILNVVPKTYLLYNTNNNLLKRAILHVNKEEGISSLQIEHSAFPKISVNILVSPDISSVNFSNVKGTGLNTGVAIEYYLSPKWRISSGVIRSNKIYGVQAENGYGYTSPSQSKLESIDAVCSVLDIPINLRYNLSPAGRGGFFVSGGLSSYLMLQEDYEFNYNNYNNSYSKKISVKGENQHFFQIINFSVGYEKRIGRSISIQGEPFLKIPFKDVGYGKVKLISTGAFLSVKYKLY